MARRIDESFEGLGYEESGWSETTSANTAHDPDWPLEEDSEGRIPPGSGTECLRVVISNTTNNRAINNTLTNYNFGAARWLIKVNSCSWDSPAAGDLVRIGTMQDASGDIAAALVIYYSGSTYQFRVRYYDGSLKNDTQGYTFDLNKWYRAEVVYDYANKRVRVDIYDLDSNLFTRDFNFTGNARQVAHINAGWANSTGKNATAELLFDQVVLEGSSYPIGPEAGHTLQVKTLLPASTDTCTWPTIVGGLTVHETLADDDDATYIETSAPSSNQNIYVGLQGATGDRGKILCVRVRVRWKSIADGLGGRILLYLGGTAYTRHRVGPTDGEFYDYVADWELNPATGKPWTWADIAAFKAGVRATGPDVFHGLLDGGRVSRLQVEVYHGSALHSYPHCGPVCGGVTPTSMKIFARGVRPSFIGDRPLYLKLRWSESPTLSSGVSEQIIPTNAGKDWTAIFSLTGLSPATTYFCDLEASVDGANYTSLHDLFGYSYYPSYRTYPASGQAKIALYSDMHGFATEGTVNQIAAADPDAVINLGDFHLDAAGDLAKTRERVKDLYMMSTNWRSKVLDHYPLESNCDDHDWFGNDACKFGSWERDDDPPGWPSDTSRDAGGKRQDIFRAYFEYRPLHDLPAENRLTGTTTSAAAGKLIDSGKSFSPDNVHALAAPYGGAWVHNLTDDTYTMVTAIDSGTQLSLLHDIMGAGDAYEIINGFWRSFRIGDAEFYMLDLRSQRDSNRWRPGIDMMDGTLMSAPKTFAPAKDSGEVYSIDGNAIVTTEKSFTSTVSAGDVIFNSNSTAWAQIVAVDGDNRLGLNTQIFSAGQSFFIYESGASRGTNARGHIQRDWFIDQMAASQAEWRVILTSVPFNSRVVGNENWGGYDTYDATTKNLQRTYINEAIENSNDIIYIASNRHYAAIDSGTDGVPTQNEWVEMSVGSPGNHPASGDVWSVGFETGNPDGQPTPTSNPLGYRYYGLATLAADVATLRIFRSDGTELSFSPHEVAATSLSASLPAYIRGAVESATVQQLAWLAGYASLTGAQSAYSAGFQGLTGAQPVHMHGAAGLTASLPGFIPGADQFVVAQPAYVNGQAMTVLVSAPAYAAGFGQLTANRLAYAAGFGQLTANRLAFVRGTLAALAAQPAFLNGGAGLNLTDNQPAFIYGLGRLIVAQPAYLQAGFLPGTLAFMLGSEQVVFPCGRLYPVREPRERLQVVSRTAGGTYRVADKGIGTQTVFISVSRLTREAFEALRRWHYDVAMQSLNTFTFYDETGAPRQVKWMGGFNLQQEGHNRYGGEIELAVLQ